MLWYTIKQNSEITLHNLGGKVLWGMSVHIVFIAVVWTELCKQLFLPLTYSLILTSHVKNSY